MYIGNISYLCCIDTSFKGETEFQNDIPIYVLKLESAGSIKCVPFGRGKLVLRYTLRFSMREIRIGEKVGSYREIGSRMRWCVSRKNVEVESHVIAESRWGCISNSEKWFVEWRCFKCLVGIRCNFRLCRISLDAEVRSMLMLLFSLLQWFFW